VIQIDLLESPSKPHFVIAPKAVNTTVWINDDYEFVVPRELVVVKPGSYNGSTRVCIVTIISGNRLNAFSIEPAPSAVSNGLEYFKIIVKNASALICRGHLYFNLRLRVEDATMPNLFDLREYGINVTHRLPSQQRSVSPVITRIHSTLPATTNGGFVLTIIGSHLNISDVSVIISDPLSGLNVSTEPAVNEYMYVPKFAAGMAFVPVVIRNGRIFESLCFLISQSYSELLCEMSSGLGANLSVTLRWPPLTSTDLSSLTAAQRVSFDAPFIEQILGDGGSILSANGGLVAIYGQNFGAFISPAAVKIANGARGFADALLCHNATWSVKVFSDQLQQISVQCIAPRMPAGAKAVSLSIAYQHAPIFRGLELWCPSGYYGLAGN
jgi:hypothetical protein